MKKTQVYAGLVSLVIASAFALLNLTRIEASFNKTFLANIYIYPVAFFVLLGLMLMFLGLKPLLRNE